MPRATTSPTARRWRKPPTCYLGGRKEEVATRGFPLRAGASCEGPANAGDVAPGLCSTARPPSGRASLATAGYGALGSAKGPWCHPGVTGQGQTERGNGSEPPRRSCYGDPLRWTEIEAGEALAAGKRPAPAEDFLSAGKSTAVPEIQEAPTPVASRGRATWKPREGPTTTRWPGRPLVRAADAPHGHKRTREAKVGGRKAAGPRPHPPALRWRGRNPGRIRAPARPDRALTRVR